MSSKYELINIIYSQLNNVPIDIEIDDWSELVKLAKSQGLLPFVCLYEQSLSDDQRNKKISGYLSNVLLQENVRSINQLHAVDDIQKACEEAGVSTLFVKGAITKNRYSNPVYRSMSDIDVLYKAQEHKEFKKVMYSLGYTDYREGRKNDTYTIPPFICVETHRDLVSNESVYYDYLKDIWSRSSIKKGFNYSYELRLEDEFIFNIIHLAEHFKHGGAGVRFILDVYVYDKLRFDRNYFEAELKKIGLYKFYEHISSLGKYWFENGKDSEIVHKLSGFVLSNNVFGTKENEGALYAIDGKFKYVIKTCFPPYEDMKSMFLWLDGKRFLLPYAWALRAVKSLVYRKNNVKSQFLKVKTGDINKGKQLKSFYEECGLV